MLENTVYSGIHSALTTLRGRGALLFVTTSKPRVFAERIVEHGRASAGGMEPDLVLGLKHRHLRMSGKGRGGRQAGNTAPDDQDVRRLRHRIRRR